MSIISCIYKLIHTVKLFMLINAKRYLRGVEINSIGLLL